MQESMPQRMHTVIDARGQIYDVINIVSVRLFCCKSGVLLTMPS
jgi:hypothetical protein